MVSNFHGSPRHFVAIEAACEKVNRAIPGTRMVSIFSVLVERTKQLVASASQLALLKELLAFCQTRKHVAFFLIQMLQR